MSPIRRSTLSRNEVDAIRAGGSELPVTANLMYDYDGLDYKKFKDVLDIVSWDNYPGWHKKEEYITAVDAAMQHDLMRSIKKAPFLLMESCPSATNWKPINKLKKTGKCFWQDLCRQLLTVLTACCTSSSARARVLPRKVHGAVIDHYGKDDTRVFREVTKVGEVLEQIQETVGTTMRSQAAVLYDRENDWAIADVQGQEM